MFLSCFKCIFRNILYKFTLLKLNNKYYIILCAYAGNMSLWEQRVTWPRMVQNGWSTWMFCHKSNSECPQTWKIHHLTNKTLGMLMFPLFFFKACSASLYLLQWVCGRLKPGWKCGPIYAGPLKDHSIMNGRWVIFCSENLQRQKSFRGVFPKWTNNQVHISFPLICITQTWFGASKLRMEASWFVRWSV